MTRRSIELSAPTDPDWVKVILGDFDAFLQDHANCERKASAMAMSLVVKYPDRTGILPSLIDLAQEELQHFREVFELMNRRGVTLVRDSLDPYIGQLVDLMRHGREERFIDRMLVSSLVECRGAERFGLIAESIDDPEVKAFYARLANGERKHGHLFAHLALQEYPTAKIYERLYELADQEAAIIRTLAWRPALH